MLSPNQLQEILEILDNQFLIFTSTHLGPQYLSDKEKEILKDSGIKYESLYSTTKDPIWLNFQLGLISSVIGENKSKSFSAKNLRKLIVQGKHISLNEREKFTLKSIKMQSLSDIKTIKGRIFNDINQVGNQEAFIRKEIEQGLKDRVGVKKIVQELGKKSGDWSRDFSKMVEYTSHKALSEGRLALLHRKGGDKQKIYIDVYEGACTNCVKHYLTGGLGSQPKIFTIEELEKNGTNIGRKQKDWKPVIPPMHPFCRCNVHEYLEGTTWNKEKRKWEDVGEYKSHIIRPKITIKVGGVEYRV